MNPPYASRKRIGLLMATLLVAGLSACQPQQPVSEETEAGQQTSRPAEPRAPEVVRVTVPQGTQVNVTLSTDIDSETNQVGDPVSATTTAAVVVGDRVAIPAGSVIDGRVTEVVAGTKGLKISEKGGAVVLSFDTVTTPAGYRTPISASIAEIAKSGGKTAAIIGGSAAGGAILGRILGDSSKDAAVGAVLGGAIGTGVAAGTKGKQLQLPAGTQLIMVLDQDLTIADRS